MREYFTEALVLDKEDLGEADSRIFLLTENMGKITAKAKSVRKITSKLAGHLEPLNFVKIRLVAGKDYQAVDALRFDRLAPSALPVMRLVKEIAMEGQPDPLLWQGFKAGRLSPEEVLRIAGFDPQFAVCRGCQSGRPDNFLLNMADYACSSCLPQFAGTEKFFRLKLSDCNV